MTSPRRPARPPRACLTTGCLGEARGTGPRCDKCQRRLDDAKNAKRAQAGDGAAGRLRRQINRQGTGHCATCARSSPGRESLYPARELQVDHFVPLEVGGTDTDDNVQALCLAHHNMKTADERRARAKRNRT